MKEALDKLWSEYLSDECAVMDTDEERYLTKKTAELHEKANALLNTEQKAAMEKYVDVLQSLDDLFVRKAFFKGCEFTFAFFWKREPFIKANESALPSFSPRRFLLHILIEGKN